MKLKNKVALITGASRGIGEAISLRFAKEGAKVILVSRSKKDLLKVKEKIDKYSVSSDILSMDVTSENIVKKNIKEIKKKYKRIDILVNCAGVFLNRKITKLSLNEWNEVININLTGTFILCKYIVPFMIKQKSGFIINFSSLGGKIGLKNKTAYCASKFGVVGFSKSLSKELKEHGIKVIVINPTLVDSKGEIKWENMYPEERSILKSQDIAEIILRIINLPMRVYIDDIDIKPYI